MKTFVVVLSVALVLFADAQVRTEYTVDASQPASRRFRIEMRVYGAEGESTTLSIPAWCPGWYIIQRYEQGLSNFSANDANGEALSVTQSGLRSWRVANKSETFTLTYDVAARELGYGFFKCYLGPASGFINGPSAFLYVDGGLNAPSEVKLRLPQDWASVSGMAPGETPNSYRAVNYDELVDCPIEIGLFRLESFIIDGVRFEMCVTGSLTPEQRAEWRRELEFVSKTAMQIMGGAPFRRYLYIIHAIGPADFANFYGGLEHMNSTVLNFSVGHSIAGLAAHELFHAWNVKRIRPKVLGPFDYSKEVRTENLWFAEGVTEYYARLILSRSGLETEEQFLSGLAADIAELQNNRARSRVTLADSSLKVWETGDSSGFGGLNYYNKGMIVGFLMDVKLRTLSDNKKSLDDVMKLLMQRHNPPKPGYDEDGILKAYSEIAGQDMASFYNKLIRSTDELPYDEVLKPFGLELVRSGRAYQLKRMADLNERQSLHIVDWAKNANARPDDR
ncbi:MAG: M61 family metallopeptidase [Armatimonadetes bacterium]|nr:M61 family metallopeptidase [Armatimonadota bacterium]